MNPRHFINRLFSVMLVLVVGLPNLSANGIAAAPAQADARAQLRGFDLLAEGTGWVLLGSELFWTSDAGQNWAEIGPQMPAGAQVQAVTFLTGEAGRVLWSMPGPDGSARFTLAQTADGGASWSEESLSLLEAGDPASFAEKAEMGWLDAQTGWISVKQASGSNFSLGTLFTTADGGGSWRRSTLPVAEQVIFSSPLSGWAVGGPAGDQVFRTLDGGLSWQDARPVLESAGDITAHLPFEREGLAALVMTSLEADGDLSLHVFNGSPGDWEAVDSLTLEAQAGVLPLFMTGAGDFTAIIPGTDTVVQMRGGALETLTNLDGNSASITRLDMLTSDVGWAESAASRCTSAPAAEPDSTTITCTTITRLLQTRDGGLSWEALPLPGGSGESAQGLAVESSLTTSIQALPDLENTRVMIGQGFDKCEIPTLAQMQTWKESSPYRAVNLYIGGSARACSNAALTDPYLEVLYGQGWSFIPTWVGPQAPCTGFISRMSSDPAAAYTQGVAEANLASNRLAALGLTLPDGTGSIAYYDIEYYGADPACRAAVNSFMNGWTAQMHARGNLSGIYGSTLCSTGLSDFQSLPNLADAIWPARWYHSAGQGMYDPTASVWDLGACLPNSAWADHQRIRQYEGDHFETWGGLTLGIDSNVLDGIVAVPNLDPSRLSFQAVTGGLSNPVFITHAGDGSGRMFILERAGRVRIYKNGALLTTPFLDIQGLVRSTSSEQGLLGLAFHPSYASNGKFYVVYTAPRTGDTVGSVLTLRQYTVSAGNPDSANAGSGSTLLTIDHPTYSNHNGGTLLFGNDGYLYWSTGDGGGGGDPFDNAQDLTRLLGKVLRINVNSGSPYSIPPTNPFFGSPDPNIKKEIWAYGLRNPWRISFDRLTHDLYIGDVGQSALEEIDFQPAASAGGENYGWDIMEGSDCYPPSSSCNPTGKVLPVAEYSHSLGCSVTGGYVYRGSSYPSLKGYYLYGDYCSGRVFSIFKNSPSGFSAPVQLADTTFNITSFGEDEQGEMYLADYGTGTIYKVHYQEPNITISGNTGVAGVTLSYVNGGPQTIVSNASGNYSFIVPQGWSGTVTPSRTGFTFLPASRSYTAVLGNRSNQNFTASWVGGVTVTSNRNIVAVGRPHVGAEVASYGGFTGGSLNAYVPMLFKGAFGGSYDSAFYIQNTHASNPASVTIRYYDSAGTLNCTKADTIAPQASKGYWVPTAACDSGSLPAGWVGGVTVTSNQPIVTVGRPHVGAQVMTYDGFASGSLTAYIPMLFKGAFGGSYDSAFYIQNTHASNTASVTIRYYDSAGTLNCTKADTIAPLASKGTWVPFAACDTGSLPSGWVGGVTVTSNQPIVGVGRPHIETQVTTYNSLAGGSISSYVPMLFKGAFGGSYDSAFYIQNTHASNTANVTIRYYDSAGTLNCTKSDTIAPLASKGTWVPFAACDSGSLPAGWVGGVTITSDQPVVTVGRPHIAEQVTTYNGFTGGSLNAHVPMMFRSAFGGSYDSALYIQNVDAANSASVTVRLYDSSGALACTFTDSITALASKGYWLPSLLCAP